MKKKLRYIVNSNEQLLKYAHNTINYEIEFPTNIFLNDVDEQQGVAAYPFIKDIKKLYNELNLILQDETAEDNSFEVQHGETFVKLKGTNKKIRVPLSQHIIRIKVNDDAFSFKDVFNMPNSIFIFRVNNYLVNNPLIKNLIENESDSVYIMSDNSKFDDNEFITAEPDTMFINTYAFNGEIDTEAFLKTFFHEFNHLAQDYNLIKKNNTRERDKARERSELVHYFENKTDLFDEIDIRCINSILYYLCGDTEINANVAGLFAELFANGILPNDINNYLKYSDAWQIINRTSNALDHIMTFTDEQLRCIHDELIKTKYVNNLSNECRSMIEFKRKLYKDIHNRLRKYIDNASKVIGFYAQVANTSNALAS